MIEVADELEVPTEVTRVDRDRLGRVLDAVRRLGALTDLSATLDAVVREVCEVGGFGVAAVNVALPSGLVRVEAVSAAAAELRGQTAALATWREILDRAQPWRDLRYYRHDEDQGLVDRLATWEPPARSGAATTGPDDWHPEDMLLAPMWAPDGALIGVVSVDDPVDGRFPDDEQLTVLELLAAQAGRAIAEADRQARVDDRARRFATAFEGASLDELRYLAGHDELTGLPNRRTAYDLLDRSLAALGPDEVVAVLACDLDGFKDVNDRWGHAAGDELLVAVTRRIESGLRPTDVLARLGGDEFVVIATVERRRLGAATELADRCVELVRPPFDLDAGRCRVTLSAGLAIHDGPTDDDPAAAAALIDRADRALYRAKAAGRDGWRGPVAG